MNFDFFMLLIFMSISSFAMAFVLYYLIIRTFGRDGKVSKLAQVLLIPLLIVGFDMLVLFADESYRYFIGSLPLAAVVGLCLYAYFFKRNDTAGFLSTPKEAHKAYEMPAKKPSKKSQRIHEARKKRGKE